MPPRNELNRRDDHAQFLSDSNVDGGKETTAVDKKETSTNLSPYDSASPMYSNPMGYGSSPMGMYGGMGGYGGGYGMYGGYGGGMMMGGGGGGGGHLSELNQFLFGLQSVMFSLSQAIQIVGMNTQSFTQLFESASTMLDSAIDTFHEMRTINNICQEFETDEQRKRRKRLKALRWAIVTAVTYSAYKLIRRLLYRPARPRMLPRGPSSQSLPQPPQLQRNPAANRPQFF